MAAVARKLGLTRARVTQLFDLLMLAADLQEQVLALEAVDGAEPMAERTIQAVAHAGRGPSIGRRGGSSRPADVPSRPRRQGARSFEGA